MTASDPAPRIDAGSMARFSTQLGTLHAIRDYAGSTSIAFIGDSITECWTWQGQSWNREWKPRRALNFGIGGDTTGNLLWRLRHGLLEGIPIPAVVQMIGVNNTWMGCDPEDVARGVGACLAEVRRCQPQARILCLAILPTDGPAGYTLPSVTAINLLLPRYAQAHGADFLDFTDKFQNKSGNVPQDLMPDGCHPAGEGYERLTTGILQWLGS